MKKSKSRFFFMIYLFLLIPFFKTDFMSRYSNLDEVLNIWKMISVMLIFFLYLKRGKATKNMILIIIFELWQVLITIFYKGNVQTICSYAIIIIALAMLIESVSILNRKMFFSALLFCFEILIYINLITMVVFPNGMYITGTTLTGEAIQNWFLGFKNIHIVFYLPAILVTLIYSELYGKKIRRNLLICAIIFCTIIGKSATSIIGISVLLMLLIFSKLSKKNRVLKFKTLMIVIGVLFLGVIIFRVQGILSNLFVDVLNKDLTFSNRTKLWDITIEDILKRPLFGHGWQDIEKRHIMYNSSTIISAHNQILEYLYIGGIVLLLIYLYIIYCIGKQINDNNNLKISNYISIIFFVLQVTYLTEVFANPIVYILIIMPLYQNALCVNEKNKTKKRSKEIYEIVNNNTCV